MDQDKLNAHEHDVQDPIQNIKDQLIELIGTDRFELWFSAPDCFTIESQKLIVSAASEFELQRIQNSFSVDIREVVRMVCGPEYRVLYRIVDRVEEPTIEAPSTISIERAKKPRRQRRLQRFLFGETNRLAEAAIDQAFREPGQLSPLFFYGPTGSGKSLLLDGMVADFRSRMNFGRCVMITAEQFTSNFVYSLRGAGLPMFRRKYRDLDVLAIDDIQFLSGKQATMVEMQYTIDHLIRGGKQVIISSDRPPAELTQLGSELCNRLTGGLTCPIKYPCENIRFKILKAMCDARSFNIPPDVLRFVSSNVSRDVRRLSGAINRIQADWLATGQRLTIEYVSEILSDLVSITAHASSMAQIERAVCDICGISPNELKSESRTKRLSCARMLAMWLSREYTSNAFSEIGHYFGGRSHSTVIAAGKRVKGWIKSDERIDLPNIQISAREAIQRIESKLGVS